MTDEQMDARLRRAGVAWRAADDVAVARQPIGSEALPIIAPDKRHHVRRPGLLASAALVVAALVAGGGFLIASITGSGEHSTASEPSLEGTVWRFVGYDSGPLNQHSTSTLYIGTDGQLVADDECEVIGAHVNVAGDRLSVSAIDQRFKDCVDTYEPSFVRGLAILRSNPRYSISDEDLTIKSDSQTMRFVAAPELAQPTLDIPMFLGSTWRLTRVIDAEGNDHPVSGEQDLQVTEGTLSVSDGCGRTLRGPVTLDGQIVHVSGLAMPGDCADGTAAVIDAVFSVPTVHEQVSGTQLTIKSNGAGELVYTWVPGDQHAVDPHRLADSEWKLVSIAGDPDARALRLVIGGTAGSLSFQDGCGWNGGDVRLGVGIIRLTGLRTGPLPGCSRDDADRATTLGSIFSAQPVLWRIEGGKLIIFSSAAQAFSLVYESRAPSPTPAPVGTRSK